MKSLEKEIWKTQWRPVPNIEWELRNALDEKLDRLHARLYELFEELEDVEWGLDSLLEKRLWIVSVHSQQVRNIFLEDILRQIRANVVHPLAGTIDPIMRIISNELTDNFRELGN